jgi:hypothetical protein
MYNRYYCPQCKAEVSLGTTKCPVCHARLTGDVGQEPIYTWCSKCQAWTLISTMVMTRDGTTICPKCAKIFPKEVLKPRKLTSQIVMVVLILAGFFIPWIYFPLSSWIYIVGIGAVFGLIIFFLFRLKATPLVLGYICYTLSVPLAILGLLLMFQGFSFANSLIAYLPDSLANLSWGLALFSAALLAIAGYGLISDARK